MTDLSVVVPTFARPMHLGRLLASVYSSDVPSIDDLEVIVVDDGSPHGTYDEVRRNFPSVRWIRQTRAGPATARNTGWHEARGGAIVFVDDDCVVTPTALKHLRHGLTTHDALGATIEPLHRGRLVADFMHAESLVSHKVEGGRVRWLVTACLAVRDPVLHQVGGFDQALAVPGGEDVDLSLRLVREGFRLGVSEEAVVYHDHRAGLLDLVRTYYRHGTAQRHLAALHPERRADLFRSARSRISPAAWFGVYRSYRTRETVVRSLLFLALRLGMMVPWLLGGVRGTRRERDR